MSEPGPSPSPNDAPLWRSPWAVAFVAGALTLTFMRDCTRRVPDAPPPIGDVPAWELVDITGEERSSGALAGSVYILAFGSADCAGGRSTEKSAAAACGVATEAAASLAETLAEKKADAVLVVVDAMRSPAKAESLANALAALDDRETVGGPWDLGFVLVDGDGKCRGFFGTHEEGRDEVMHRSQHVVRDAQARGK